MIVLAPDQGLGHTFTVGRQQLFRVWQQLLIIFIVLQAAS